MNIQFIINKVLAADPPAVATDPNISIKFGDFKGTGEDLTSMLAYVNTIIEVALDVAMIIGVVMIFVSAFLYVSSFGEEAKAETAKKTLLWAVIGTFAVFAARLIINTVGNMLA